MKRTALVLAVILMVVSITISGVMFVNVGKANPIVGHDWVSADTNTYPPLISITYLENNSAYGLSNISLNLNVTVGYSKTASFVRLMNIYYETDWQEKSTNVYHNDGIYIPGDPYAITEFSKILNLTEIPEGRHTITFYAIEWGAYIEEPYAHMFSINGSSSVNFTIDVVSPNISVLSPMNSTYDSSNVPLNFVVDDSVSHISYVLNGMENVTVGGNTTLTKLTNGEHSVTVYVTDKAGNIGISELVYFTVDMPETLSTAVAVTASVAALTVVAAGFMIYLKKRRH